ncbi:MAG TPA: TIM-barrel domain-containing protein [Fimbriimonadaceae bacterium]|jgi:alpha-glucosidase
MFFNKFPHPSNFVYANGFNPAANSFKAGKRDFQTKLSSFETGVHHVRVSHSDWGENRAIHPLTPPPPCDCSPVKAGENFELSFRHGGEEILKTAGASSFGVCGTAWMFRFEVQPGTRFYGMGEKNFGRLELSGIRTKFWNTDVWGDFHYSQFKDHTCDPPYLSIPYVILKQGETFVGILLDTPATTFIETPGLDTERVFEAWQTTTPELVVGAECGEANLWVIVGPTLKELTRKLQHLVGHTPLPPIWALGYHQSRWGYAGQEDLLKLDEEFRKHEIPCDSLWLDIDYMEGFRVFTVDEKHFPEGLKATSDLLAKNNRKLVAILDPGVKREKGFEVYDDLKAKNLHCVNPEGEEYVGMVWPGETIFPDLTLEPARKWWAGYVKKMAQDGLSAVWIDMNDPSTGPVDPKGMLFRHGRDRHEEHRNQYALGMQIASRDGFLKADSNSRPFILSRSGSTGSAKYSAIWTGDNLSNYFYLKICIPTTLNLSLSGVCFNGPDVGGFGDTATETLMLDWIKACFLFPFMRNHSSKETGDQEPWQYSEEGVKIISKFVRLRYKFLPYIYNLFIEHEKTGDPILRPLMYEIDSAMQVPLEDVADQFFVGPSILQAPIIDAEHRTREVILPGETAWFSASRGRWIEAGTSDVAPADSETPLFFKAGAIVPLRPGTPTDVLVDLRNIDLLICAHKGSRGSSFYHYVADDGRSFDYKNGVRSEISVKVEWDGDEVKVNVEEVATGFGSIRARLIFVDGFERVLVKGARVETKVEELELTGAPFAVYVTM